ncbi:MAG TPA: hypothetical protein VGC97_19435 [Pyrinomonadaceae bacterium]
MFKFTLKSFRFGAVICSVLFLVVFAFAQKSKVDQGSLAQEFVKDKEVQLVNTDDSLRRFSLLRNLAPAALSAGDREKAKKYAEELMIVAKKMESTSRFGPGNLGFATHVSNTVLGLIAMDEGDVTKAKEYLLASGQIKGDPPVLLSFGPNMLLAKRLLEQGERKVVIEYLDLCAAFWKEENGRLEKWRETINKGGMPDFGPSLVTSIDSWRFA